MVNPHVKLVTFRSMLFEKCPFLQIVDPKLLVGGNYYNEKFWGVRVMFHHFAEGSNFYSLRLPD